MSKMTRVILIYGGKSGEHEVSLISAASVLAHLNPASYEVIPIGMDKEGVFYLNDASELKSYPDSLPVKTNASRILPNLVINGKLAVDADVVFPVVHGPLYEDGCLQGLLELADVAYVGCDVLSSAIAMDKDMARRVGSVNGDILSAQYEVLSWHASSEERTQFCERVVASLGWPLFVKPCSLGSSVGIHKVRTMTELSDAIADALRYDEAVIVEEFIQGREIEVSVLENALPTHPPHVSTPGEICVRHIDGFYSYTAKYLESAETELIAAADLDTVLIKQIQSHAATIFSRLKCKGMARVDFFVNTDRNVVYFNEINTIPGFTSISMYPKMWEASGLSYVDLLDKLIVLARVHHRCRQQLVTHYQ